MEISKRGQITIPQRLREKHGLRKGVEVELVSAPQGVLIRKRARGQHPVDRVAGILKRPGSCGEYIERLRGR